MAETGPPTPPQELEAERAFLGNLLLEPSLIDTYVHALPADAFHKQGHRTLWATMQALHGAGQGIDIITVRAELRRLDVFEEVGGDTYLALLEAEGTVATEIASYVDLIREAATKRDLCRLLYSASNGRPTRELIPEIQDTLDRLVADTPMAQPAAFRPAAKVMRDPPPVAVIAGVAWRRCVSVLVSESGAGKTFVLLDMSAAVQADRPWHGRTVRAGSVAYASFEGDALGLRLQALQEAGTDLSHLYVLQAVEPLSPRVDRDGTESPSAGELGLRAALATLTAHLAAAAAPPLALLVVDTVRASLVGSEDGSEHVSAYLRAVRRLLAPYPDAAGLLAHHAGWQDGETKRKRERGSSAFRGNVDATVYLEVTDENRELGEANLTLTALKVRDDARPAPLRLRRTTVTLPIVDADGRALRTCRIEPDPRSRQDLADEQARVTAQAEAALDQRGYALLTRHTITSLKAFRYHLEVKSDVAEAVMARLVQAGRVQAPGRKRDAYTAIAPNDTA